MACRPWARYLIGTDAWARMAAGLPAEPTLSLIALWADAGHAHAILLDEVSLAVLPVSVAVEAGFYPALSPSRPAAAWLERMIFDLWGHTAFGGTDPRPWLDHGRWPNLHPMASPPRAMGPPAEPPEFLPAEGEDLNQVPVGPIHAGVIEPGHFRFSASGETVMRLEVRLGYAHKGTLGLMRGKSVRVAARFAARLSGDTTVAHAAAFSIAVEAALAVEIPARAKRLRAAMLEIERVANHLGDAGAICNDTSFAFLHARFGYHREAMLRASAVAFGHRLMMDTVVPGGLADDVFSPGLNEVLVALAAVEAELPELIRNIENHSSLADRLVSSGIVSAELARRFAAGGFVGRASGRGFDARRLSVPDGDVFHVRVAMLAGGDVDARLRIRLAEIVESTRLIRLNFSDLPEGAICATLPEGNGEGIGCVEGFRGDTWAWLRIGSGNIEEVFLRDPSWFQWPLLEAAVRGNILADFPLINKSFNCSYSGVDL